MEQAIVAVGSNLGDRLAMLQLAAGFLESISLRPIEKSSVWESEPVGAAKFKFLNCAATITVDTRAEKLLQRLKDFELKIGRDPDAERWSPRILDLDIIRFGNRIVNSENLRIPHPEFKNRLFVLLPVQEIYNGYIDPVHPVTTKELIKTAPVMEITKTDLKW